VTLMPLYVLAPGPVGLTPAGFGVLLAAWGGGALAGAALAGTIVDRMGRARTLLGATLVAGLALVTLAATAAAPLVVAAYLVAGGALATWGTVNASIRQLSTPDELRGRVNATHRTMSFAAGVAGATTAGLVADRVGITPVIAAGGVVVLLGLLGSRTVLRGLAPARGEAV
jgi:predicted MFS family arabinose efflux permease